MRRLASDEGDSSWLGEDGQTAHVNKLAPTIRSGSENHSLTIPFGLSSSSANPLNVVIRATSAIDLRDLTEGSSRFSRSIRNSFTLSRRIRSLSARYRGRETSDDSYIHIPYDASGPLHEGRRRLLVGPSRSRDRPRTIPRSHGCPVREAPAGIPRRRAVRAPPRIRLGLARRPRPDDPSEPDGRRTLPV